MKENTIKVAKAIWTVSPAKAQLCCTEGRLRWSLHIYGDQPVVTDEDLEVEPYFYSDYFVPFGCPTSMPFESFDRLFLANGDEFQSKGGDSAFACYLGSHEFTERNHLRFGVVQKNCVELEWAGVTPVYSGRFEGLVPFSLKCTLIYAGVQVRDTCEADARKLIQAIDPSRTYRMQPTTSSAIFHLVPE